MHNVQKACLVNIVRFDTSYMPDGKASNQVLMMSVGVYMTSYMGVCQACMTCREANRNVPIEMLSRNKARADGTAACPMMMPTL